MAFNTQEQEIIRYGIANGKSRQEVEQAISNYRAGVVPKKTEQVAKKETLGSKLTETGKETISSVKETAGRIVSGETNPVLGAVQIAGNVAGGVTGAVGDVISSTPIVSSASEAGGQAVGGGLKATQEWLTNNPTFQKIVTSDVANKIASILDSNPDIARTAEAVNNIANAVLIAKGGVQSAGTVKNVAKEGVESAVNLNKNIIESAKTTAQNVSSNPLVQGAVDITKMAGEGISRVPARIKTNVAERQAVEAEIKALPSQVAQTAVRDGVDIVDVKALPELSKIPESKNLIETVKKFSKGETDSDPIEVIGNVAVNRFKELVKQKKEIGAKLGEASKSIGILTKPELENGVINKLKSVPGLENITVTPKGNLNFKGTVLEADLSSTRADKIAIQEAYKQAVKWGDGEKAHMFRQTLFENLGGKKRSLENITDTQEKAFEAIRSGLSDVIETKSPSYKLLSNEYRKIVGPISQLQKKIKILDPTTQDLTDANLSAGILARRITSAAASNAEIRQLLKSLDSVGTTKGATFEKSMQLQNLYNILNKYYDIAPKTGFQNLSKEAINSSPLGAIKETLVDVAGKSNAVRQKALEDLLNEVFKGK